MTPDHAAELALLEISRLQREEIRTRWTLVLIEAGEAEPAAIAGRAVADLLDQRADAPAETFHRAAA